jgi:hypothetical protein
LIDRRGGSKGYPFLLRNYHGKTKKVVEEVITEVVKEEVKLPKAVFEKTVTMVRSEDYPMPRTANVHLEEVSNWERHGWVKA